MTTPDKPLASSVLALASGKSLTPLDISAPASNRQRASDFIQSSTAVEISNSRILALAADGLRVRDIASILHIHPLIVQRVLGNDRYMSVTEPLPNRSDDDVMTVFRAVPSQS